MEILIGFIIVAVYSFIGGVYYGVTKDEEEAFLWIFYFPATLGAWLVKKFNSNGKEKTDTKGEKK